MFEYFYNLIFGDEVIIWDAQQRENKYRVLKDIVNKKYVLNHWCQGCCNCFHYDIYESDSDKYSDESDSD